METIKLSKTGYIETCPHCKHKLKPANSENTAKANLKQHLTFCEKNPLNKENGK